MYDSDENDRQNHLKHLLAELVHQPGWYLQVDASGHKERLDRFLARRLKRVSRSRAGKLEVMDLLDPDKSFKKSSRVFQGQHLWIARPIKDEEIEELTPPRIIWMDEHLLIVDKPSGWIIHPTAHRFHSTIQTWLMKQGYQAQAVHRLDQETSGILICARHKKSLQHLNQAFQMHKVHKTYLALCEGLCEVGTTWDCHTPLGFDAESAVHLKIGVGCAVAHTQFQVIATHQTSQFSCIQARPYTGRQHQIRVHLSMSGYPIIGDKLYGVDEKYFLAHLTQSLQAEDWAVLKHKRHALHAHQLHFELFNRSYTITSPWPSDLQKLFPLPNYDLSMCSSLKL